MQTIQTLTDKGDPPNFPPCLVGNHGDDIEDLGERIASLTLDQLRLLSMCVNLMLEDNH